MPRRLGERYGARAVVSDSVTQGRVLELVMQHGWNATSFQILGEGYRYFFHGGGCVAYVDTGAAWVVAGAPIAASDELGAITAAFIAAAEGAGRRCCFFATEQRFIEATEGLTRSLRVGEQPVWDPGQWPQILRGDRKLREQLRRARAKGVTVRELTPEETRELRNTARGLIDGWLATRGMPPMGFLVQLAPFAYEGRRTWFVAEIDAKVVALASVIPVPRRKGWFIEHLIRAPHTPNGTVELLIDAVMTWAHAQECRWVTLGLAPLAGDVPWPLRFARRRTALLYDFDGLRRFKAKLRPSEWQPIYVSYPARQRPSPTIVDVLAAFTERGFIRFGVRALLRGPTIALVVLAALLAPWTLLLAAAPTDVWFAGHGAVKWAWVGFDLLVLLGLVRLARRPSLRLTTVLAVMASFDAVATPIEAMSWNVQRIRGPLDALIVIAACSAPIIAAVVLWGARARLRRIARSGRA